MTSVPRTKDPVVIKQVAMAVVALGLPQLTTQKVINYLGAQLPPFEISPAITRSIMRDTLGLTFKQCKFANDRQTDSQFDA